MSNLFDCCLADEAGPKGKLAGTTSDAVDFRMAVPCSGNSVSNVIKSKAKINQTTKQYHKNRKGGEYQVSDKRWHKFVACRSETRYVQYSTRLLLPEQEGVCLRAD
jgi:hypothetical protein